MAEEPGSSPGGSPRARSGGGEGGRSGGGGARKGSSGGEGQKGASRGSPAGGGSTRGGSDQGGSAQAGSAQGGGGRSRSRRRRGSGGGSGGSGARGGAGSRPPGSGAAPARPAAGGASSGRRTASSGQGRGGGGRGGRAGGRGGSAGPGGGGQSGDRTGGRAATPPEAAVVAADDSGRFTEAVPAARDVRGDAGARRHNRRRALAIAAIPAVIVFVVIVAACLAAGATVVGLAVGAVAGLASWLGLWRAAPGVVLRALGVRPGTDAELQRAENIVEGLCATMGVEPPELVVLDDKARQAMAIGRPGVPGVVVVTSGLLHALDPVALEGVLAHELVHVKRDDTAPATMAAVVLLPVAGFLPVADMVHTLAGRGREFLTDRLAVAVTRYPPGLRDALVVMAEGPAPAPPSPLAGGGIARATRWLWTVALAETPGGSMLRSGAVGELDAPGVRIAALDEW